MKNEVSIYPPRKIKGFTLAEVLITLVIIGVIAAITVPSLIQSSREKEFHSMLKKNFSVLQNSLQRAQVEEGLIGDNTVVFTPSSDSNKHYESAKRLAKYLNTVKICKRHSDTNCSNIYYPINYSTQRADFLNTNNCGGIVLSDGSIYKITQYENCSALVNDCIQDKNGICKKDENGNTTNNDWERSYCAEVIIDVNGVKKPNKLGKDVFVFRVYQDKVTLASWKALGTDKQRDIILNKY